jgi:flagellar assembly protein FliH
MSLPRARILRASETGELVPLSPERRPAIGRGQRVDRAQVAASERAKAIVEQAEQRARAIMEQAALAAGEVRVKAEAEGRADGVAALAAKAIALSAHEAREQERALERVVALARVLAERLLGEELRLDPGRVLALARQALTEARGARQIRLLAHPEDVRLLERSLGELGLEHTALTLSADLARARGSLRLETEIGVLDAELAPQLDRLVERLARSLPR